MSLSARERKLAAVTGAIAVAAVLYLIVDRWVIPTWQGVSERIGTAEEDLANVKAVVAVKDRRQAEYAACVGLALRTASPSDAELVFRRKLNALARQAAMNEPNISAISPKREDHYDVIQFHFNIKCTFDQFFAFLEAFYAHEGGHRIDSIIVKPAGKYLSDDDLVSVTMTISALVIPEGGKKPPRKRGAA